MAKAMQLMAVEDITPNPRNARTHSKKQIRQIADSIKAFGFTMPLLIDETGMLLAGHGRLEAAKMLGWQEVPVIAHEGLSEAKKRALMIADNKIAENAGWDRQRLAVELPELGELLITDGLDLSITGLAPVEIDQLASDFEANPSDPADDVDSVWLKTAPVSRPGDLWQLGPHRLLCGDARSSETLERLMLQDRAAIAFLDPPYNVVIKCTSGKDTGTQGSR